MRGNIILATAGVGGALLLAAGGSSALAARSAPTAVSAASHHDASAVGTWLVTVTPVSPAGPQFASTIVLTGSGALIEATSRSFAAPTADTSEGLGVWESDGTSIKATFQKYAYDSNGNYISRSVIVETDVLQGANAYNGTAVATIYTPSGTVIATLTSTTQSVRMHL